MYERMLLSGASQDSDFCMSQYDSSVAHADPSSCLDPYGALLPPRDAPPGSGSAFGLPSPACCGAQLLASFASFLFGMESPQDAPWS